jgi:hypothetical protein
MANQIHVLPGEAGGWDIKRDDSDKATLHAATKEDAVQRAREIAKKQEMELVIHNQDGTISEKDSYGNDPSPPKG